MATTQQSEDERTARPDYPDEETRCQICDEHFPPELMETTEVDAIDTEATLCPTCRTRYDYESVDGCLGCGDTEADLDFHFATEFLLGADEFHARVEGDLCYECAEFEYPEVFLWGDHRALADAEWKYQEGYRDAWVEHVWKADD